MFLCTTKITRKYPLSLIDFIDVELTQQEKKKQDSRVELKTVAVILITKAIIENNFGYALCC